jgi:hypothetical protein
MIRLLHTFRFYVSTRGWDVALSRSATFPIRRVRRAFDQSRDRRRKERIQAGNNAFDKAFGVDTFTETPFVADDVGGPSAPQANGYAPVSLENFSLAMSTVKIRHEDFTFVDLGSGKGKALLLASDYPFRQIIGVELSAQLHRVAVENIARYRGASQRCHNIESVCQDAIEFEFPLSPLVIFLANPFGPDILARVLDRLEASLASHPRPCFVVYIVPEAAVVVRQRKSFIALDSQQYYATWRYWAPGLGDPAAGGVGLSKQAAW